MIADIITAPATAPSTMPAKTPPLIPDAEDTGFTVTKKKGETKRKNNHKPDQLVCANFK